VGGTLGVQILLGGPLEHQGQDDLGEQDALQIRLRGDRLGQPSTHFGGALLGDDVALAVGAVARLSLVHDDLAVAGEAAQRRIHLPERQRLPPAEEHVVVALEVIAMARLTLKQAQQCQRNAHGPTIHGGYTSRIYSGVSQDGEEK
jgi:hypothetical protein